MITGFEVGAKVKWNEENTLTTGVIRKVFYTSQDVEVGGQFQHVEINDNAPVYLVQHHTGDMLLLAHQDLFLKDMNTHT